jgi:hypothetical protein
MKILILMLILFVILIFSHGYSLDLPQAVLNHLKQGPADTYPNLALDNNGNYYLFYYYNNNEFDDKRNLVHFNRNPYFLMCFAPDYTKIKIYDDDFTDLSGFKSIFIADNGTIYCGYGDLTGYLSIFDSNGDFVKEVELGYGIYPEWAGVTPDGAYFSPCWSGKESCSFIKVNGEGIISQIGNTLTFSRQLDDLPFVTWNSPQIMFLGDSIFICVGHSRNMKSAPESSENLFGKIGLIAYNIVNSKIIKHVEFDIDNNPNVLNLNSYIDHTRLLSNSRNEILVFSIKKNKDEKNGIMLILDRTFNLVSPQNYQIEKLSVTDGLNKDEIENQFVCFMKNKDYDKLGVVTEYLITADHIYSSESDLIYNEAEIEYMQNRKKKEQLIIDDNID